LPDYDEDRVYVSDIKKIIQWYNLLQEKGKMDFSKPVESESTELSKGDDSPIKVAPKKAAPKNLAPKVSSSKKGGAGKNTSARKT